jgi:hypothetical protein
MLKEINTLKKAHAIINKNNWATTELKKHKTLLEQLRNSLDILLEEEQDYTDNCVLRDYIDHNWKSCHELRKYIANVGLRHSYANFPSAVSWAKYREFVDNGNTCYCSKNNNKDGCKK